MFIYLIYKKLVILKNTYFGFNRILLLVIRIILSIPI